MWSPFISLFRSRILLEWRAIEGDSPVGVRNKENGEKGVPHLGNGVGRWENQLPSLNRLPRPIAHSTVRES